MITVKGNAIDVNGFMLRKYVQSLTQRLSLSVTSPNVSNSQEWCIQLVMTIHTGNII